MRLKLHITATAVAGDCGRYWPSHTAHGKTAATIAAADGREDEAIHEEARAPGAEQSADNRGPEEAVGPNIA